jgi:O-antigen/teichoic acid export membrane protein
MLAETGLVATRPLFPMVFNLYSRVQDDAQRLARSFSIVNYFLARVMCAGAVVLLVFPAETVRLLLGDDWVGTAPLLRWLALYTALVPIYSNFRQLLSGTGRVSQNARIAAIQLVLFLPAVFASAFLGSAQGAAASLVLVTLTGVVLSWRASLDLQGEPPLQLLLTPAALTAATAALFGLLHAMGVVGQIAWFARPFLPPLVYAAGLLALEHATLRGELVYLRRQLRR